MTEHTEEYVTKGEMADEITRLKGEVEEWRQKYIQAHEVANGLDMNLTQSKEHIAELEAKYRVDRDGWQAEAQGIMADRDRYLKALQEMITKLSMLRLRTGGIHYSNMLWEIESIATKAIGEEE
jgi:hypothetical protein